MVKETSKCKIKRPKGDSRGGGDPTGPNSKGGAFVGSISEDLKDAGKGIVDSFTAPIMALPGAKSLGKAIGAVRSFEPTTSEDETQDKKIDSISNKVDLDSKGGWCWWRWCWSDSW